MKFNVNGRIVIENQQGKSYESNYYKLLPVYHRSGENTSIFYQAYGKWAFNDLTPVNGN